jgi:translation initiation factor eIF-2B subunit alpha
LYDVCVDFEVAAPVAAIKVLTSVIEEGGATTMMELKESLRSATGHLMNNPASSSIAVRAGCELFQAHVTRYFDEGKDFDECKRILIQRGAQYADLSAKSRQTISEFGKGFIRDNATILTHGLSRVVQALLLKAAETARFKVLLACAHDGKQGYKQAKVLSDAGIPVTIILDSAVAYVIETVEMVIVGAVGVGAPPPPSSLPPPPHGACAPLPPFSLCNLPFPALQLSLLQWKREG